MVFTQRCQPAVQHCDLWPALSLNVAAVAMDQKQQHPAVYFTSAQHSLCHVCHSTTAQQCRHNAWQQVML